MSDKQDFPQNWKIGADFDPNEHLMKLSGRDYLNVQNRLLWFIRDQRALIVAGLAQMPYIVRTELVETDNAQGFAHFKTYVRDVLGNEATMYGSESVKDFKDYAEKASTKSLGRALLALGYGTAFAPEMDEGDRVVDSPIEPRTQQTRQSAPASRPAPQQKAKPEPATREQLSTLQHAYKALGKPFVKPAGSADAAAKIIELRDEWKRTHPKQEATAAAS